MTNSLASAKTPPKYLFDSEFDYSETVEDIQSITPKKHHEDLEAAKKQAYQEGYDEGVKITNEGIQRMAGDQLFVITSKIETLIETEKTIMDAFHQQIAQVCDLVTSKILPVLAKQGARQEIKGLLERVHANLPSHKKVIFYIHPSLKDIVEQYIKNLDEKSVEQDLSYQVIGDPALQETDCRITWDGAGIEHYIDATKKQVHDMLMRLAKEPLSLDKKVHEEQIPEAQTIETQEDDTQKNRDTRGDIDHV